MGIFSRWRKKPYNTIVVDAQLIRDIISEDVDFPINAMLYDYVNSVSDDDLNHLGEAIVDDGELWMCLTDVVISYTVSMRFTELMQEADIESQ